MQRPCHTRKAVDLLLCGEPERGVSTVSFHDKAHNGCAAIMGPVIEGALLRRVRSPVASRAAKRRSISTAAFATYTSQAWQATDQQG